MSFDRARSRLSIGGSEVSFHCDKFNTRIRKNFEDVLGNESAGTLLFEMAERTTYEWFKTYLAGPSVGPSFQGLSPREQAEVILQLFGVLAYGAVAIEEISEQRALFTSKHSYLAEGGWRTRRGGTSMSDQARRVTTSVGISPHSWRSCATRSLGRIVSQSADAGRTRMLPCASFSRR